MSGTPDRDIEQQTSSATRQLPSGAGRLVLVVAAGVLLVLLGVFLGSHRSATRIVTGPAYVGDREVSMTAADGTVYGFSESMPWIDASGSWHEGGWPDCLGAVTTLPSVTFGVTRVDHPDGGVGDQVVYVDCRR